MFSAGALIAVRNTARLAKFRSGGGGEPPDRPPDYPDYLLIFLVCVAIMVPILIVALALFHRP